MDQEGSDVSGSVNSTAINLSSRPASAPTSGTPNQNNNNNKESSEVEEVSYFSSSPGGFGWWSYLELFLVQKYLMGWMEGLFWMHTK